MTVAAKPRMRVNRRRRTGHAGLRAGTVRHLEAELRDYHQTKRALADLERQIAERGMGIAYDTQQHEQQASPEWSDPTPKRASALATHKLLERMRDTTRAIDNVYGRLPERYRRVVDVYYWGQRFLPVRQAAALLDVHEATFRRWRSVIIDALAEEVGEW